MKDLPKSRYQLDRQLYRCWIASIVEDFDIWKSRILFGFEVDNKVKPFTSFSIGNGRRTDIILLESRKAYKKNNNPHSRESLSEQFPVSQSIPYVNELHVTEP